MVDVSVDMMCERAVALAVEAVNAKQNNYLDAARVFAGLARIELGTVRSHFTYYLAGRDRLREVAKLQEAERLVGDMLEPVRLNL